MRCFIYFLFWVMFFYTPFYGFDIYYKLSPDTKIFSSMKDIKENMLRDGDIIVVLDDGGKISRIDVDKDSSIKMNNATIEDAFEELDVRYFYSLIKNDISESKYYYDGVELISERDPKNFKIKLSDVVLYDYDGDKNTKDDRVTIEGLVDILSNLDWHIKVEKNSIKEINFRNAINQSSDFKINISTPIRIPIPFSKEFKLAEYEFSPIVVGPVVFTPILSVIVGLSVGVAGRFDVDINQRLSSTHQIQYIDGEWRYNSDVNDKSFKGFVNFIGADGWIEGYIGPQLKLNFYNTFGPYIEGFGFIRTQADLLNYKPLKIDWKLYSGIKANAGASVKIFSLGMNEFEKNIYKYEVLINSGVVPSEKIIKISLPIDNIDISEKIKNLAISFQKI